MSVARPRYRHVFKLADGETLIVADREAQRVLDRRNDAAPVETCWDVTLPSGLIRRLWPSDVLDWSIEER